MIEDKGSGTSLIQELRHNNFEVIGINPEGDKPTRAANISSKFEAGAVFFPKSAPWLDALKAELLAFPNVKHDDQVDSVTQAITWIKKSYQPVRRAAPIFITRPRTYFGAIPRNF